PGLTTTASVVGPPASASAIKHQTARRLSLRRSRSDRPPQIPNRSSLASAYSRHSTRTSHAVHTRLASRVEPPFSGKKASGSVWAHSARSCQPRTPSSGRASRAYSPTCGASAGTPVVSGPSPSMFHTAPPLFAGRLPGIPGGPPPPASGTVLRGEVPHPGCPLRHPRPPPRALRRTGSGPCTRCGAGPRPCCSDGLGSALLGGGHGGRGTAHPDGV